MPANVLVNKARERGLSAPGADTPVLSTGVTWRSNNMCRLTIQLTDTDSVVKLTVTEGGLTTKLVANAKTAVPFGAAYTFDFAGMRRGDVLNVELETDGAIDFLALDEVAA